ncbi:hypothetical protein ACWCO3_14235 [Micromonospora sp. NPDC002411]
MHDPEIAIGSGVLIGHDSSAAPVGTDQQPPVGIDAAVVDQGPHPEGMRQADGEITLVPSGGVGDFGVTGENPTESLILVGRGEHGYRTWIVRPVLDPTDVHGVGGDAVNLLQVPAQRVRWQLFLEVDLVQDVYPR